MTKPETKNETEASNRMWASASFVGVLIVIGLPLWWKTTEVYRVALPYNKISSLHTLPHTISTDLVVLANDLETAAKISQLIEKAFEDEELLTLNITKGILSQEDSLHENVEHQDTLAALYNLTHNKFLVVQQPKLLYGGEANLASERILYFRNTESGPTVVKALKQWVYQTSVLRGARAESADVARQTRFPPGDNYHIVLSVVQPKADYKVEFNAREAVEDYVGSFVDELSELHNFTLKSQWLFLLDFDFQVREIKDSSDRRRHFATRIERLPQLLTALEERAATHVSDAPTVNLALYAVPCHTAPLIIYDNQDKPISTPVQAFMSPKWGGVVLDSPTAEQCRSEVIVHKPDTRVVMGAFVSQLRKLLGIPDYEAIESATLSPLRGVTPRRWEVDSLLRVRTVEQITSAQRTLQSLAQLLGEISNIVINDEVGASINSAVENIDLATSLMKEGRLLEAYRTSQRAFNAAETAFMEPSLLALLYFPDDQKYAIYIPLFLPIMFPVVLSLKNLILWLRGKPVHKKID